MYYHLIIIELILWYNDEDNILNYSNYLKKKYGSLKAFASYIARTVDHKEVDSVLKRIKTLNDQAKGLNQVFIERYADPEKVIAWYKKQTDERNNPTIDVYSSTIS